MAEESQDTVTLTVGSPAPGFTLPGRSGASVSLADFGGKHVLVYFYPKDDTPGCTKEACSLRDGWSELQSAGVTVLGISPDDAASHNAFAAKYSLPFELLTDADHSVHEAYGVWGKRPWGMGTLRKSFLVGPDGAILHVFSKVDVENHAAQVLAALRGEPFAQPGPAAEAKVVVEAAVEKAGEAVQAVVAEARKVAEETMEKPVVRKAVAGASKAVEDAKKAIADAQKKPAVKKAVAEAKKAVKGAKKAIADAQKKPAVKKAVAGAKKAVKGARKAIAEAQRKPAVRKAVAQAKKAAAGAKKAVRRATKAAEKKAPNAFSKLMALVSPRKKAAPARKKAAPARKKAAPARKKAAPARRKAQPVRKKAAARKPAARKAPGRKAPARKPAVRGKKRR